MKLRPLLLLQTLAWAGLLASTGCRLAPSGRGPWISLFNGTNLSGWVVKCLAQDRQ